ncbi:hypothetical protein D9M73_283980 [compost metagenome]
MQQLAFSNLQDQAGWRQACFLQYVDQPQGEVDLLQLGAGNVHRAAQAVMPGQLPEPGLLAGLAQYPFADADDLPRLLQRRDELQG